LIIKIFLSYYTLFPIANALDEKDLILFLPLWEFVYGIHLIVLTFYSLVAKKQVWK